ncbi:telomerase activating protein Est1 [Wolffia australiana]
MSNPDMDSSPPVSRSREVAQRLFQKNLELEEARRKAAKLKIPSDQNAWSQMRDNFEAILLEDHDFSEKHGVEYSLWQLHHKKIDEFRAHLNAASAVSQDGKSLSRPDRAKKIFSSFKSFLSEASGFYHDLILKIRSKYGLPLVYLSEGLENESNASNDSKKSADVKKALISCHRSLIFLGDLARYKGMYGEGDSASRDYAAASSYYLQAASLWPSSGNPHHQLAILSICTDENEVTTIYRYFRSLAVENPLLTARDNLTVAFEKNRQKCSQLPPNPQASPLKIRTTGRGRGYSGAPEKSLKREDISVKNKELNMPEIFKAFCVRFVRLNGILYTRTSLETFAEIFSSSLSNLSDLLSLGQDESVDGIFLLKLVAILIFSVYNVSKESENQSYAGILQRSVLLQNAFTAAFEFMGLVLKRCVELHDVTTSYLLPSVLVFTEWLASDPDIASGIEVEEKQASARSLFFTHFVSLMNRLLLTGAVSFGGEEDAFFQMSRYDEDEETENLTALWEDFELRGFVPLAPAHLILKFPSSQSYVTQGSGKGKKFRIQRILAAGKALTNVVIVDQKKIYFDSKAKKYILSDQPPSNEDETPSSQSKVQIPSDGEEDEVILFKPTISEKPINGHGKSTIYDVSNGVTSSDWSNYPGANLSIPSVTNAHVNPLMSSPQQPLQALSGGYSITGGFHQPMQSVYPTSMWSMNQNSFSDGLQNLRLTDENFRPNRGPWGGLSLIPDGLAPAGDWLKPVRPVIPPNPGVFLPMGAAQNDVIMTSSPTVSDPTWQAPVSRPVRRLGPPPGFSSVLPERKPLDLKEQSALVDDYGWLDGYSAAVNGPVSGASLSNGTLVGNRPQEVISSVGNSDTNSLLSFPFPGKQVPSLQQIQNLKQGNQQPVPEIEKPQSLWPNYFV